MNPTRIDPTTDMLKFFEFKHLPEPLQTVSSRFAAIARYMHDTVPMSPEKTAGMRKLLEAKDCMVRASL